MNQLTEIRRENISLQQQQTANRVEMATLTGRIQSIPQGGSIVPGAPFHPQQGFIKSPKMADVPYFTGKKSSDYKFQDWLDQMSLYLAATGIADDKDRILYALSRVTGNAANHLRDYHRLIAEAKGLGTWESFIQRMSAQFGQRDITITAHQELLKLWTAGAANGDFMAYSEKYRTVARIDTGTSDESHLKALKQVVPQNLLDSLLWMEFSDDPNIKDRIDTWEKYLDTLVQVYKYKNPEKVKGSLFTSFGSSNRDPNAMDTSTAEKSQKGKGKAKINQSEKRLCSWCSKNGHEQAAKCNETAMRT